MDADDGDPTNSQVSVHGEHRPEGRSASVGDAKPRRIAVAWRVTSGEVAMPVHVAEWWGAALSVLIAAVHHPHVLADQQPEAVPVAVAREVLRELPELQHAADIAAAQGCAGDDRPATALVRRHDDNIVISPGVEVSNLALVLEIIAGAVLDPASDEARMARGALGHSASAWSRDIGRASGALDDPLKRSPCGGTGVGT